MKKNESELPQITSIKDFFYQIGGLKETFTHIGTNPAISPRWRKGIVECSGKVGASSIHNLIKGIQQHPNFDRFLRISWDDCEARAQLSHNNLKMVVEILTIDIHSQNNVTADIRLWSYQLVSNDL